MTDTLERSTRSHRPRRRWMIAIAVVALVTATGSAVLAIPGSEESAQASEHRLADKPRPSDTTTTPTAPATPTDPGAQAPDTPLPGPVASPVTGAGSAPQLVSAAAGSGGTLTCPDGRAITVDHAPTASEIGQLCGTGAAPSLSGSFVGCPDGRMIWIDHTNPTNDEMLAICGISASPPPPPAPAPPPTTQPPAPAVQLASRNITVDWSPTLTTVNYSFTYTDGRTEQTSRSFDPRTVPSDGVKHRISWPYASTVLLGTTYTLWIDVTATVVSDGGLTGVAYSHCVGVS